MTKLANKLRKGDYAIAHEEHVYSSLYAGTQHWSRYYIVKVQSATREGMVKTYTKSPKLETAPERNNSRVTIYTIPAAHIDGARALYPLQNVDFTGYHDKEHLRLSLVNQAIKDAA